MQAYAIRKLLKNSHKDALKLLLMKDNLNKMNYTCFQLNNQWGCRHVMQFQPIEDV